MKTLHLTIIAIMGITVIGIILFAVILPSQPKKIEGLDQDTGIVTMGIQSYYFTTVNDTMTTVRGEGVQELFHNVVFTFFPSPAYMGDIGSCGGITFGSDVKFSDDIHELLQVPLFGPPCGKDYFKTDFSNHTDPQAGLAVYDEKIKLLVSTDKYMLQQNMVIGSSTKISWDTAGQLANETASKYGIFPHEITWFVHVAADGKFHPVDANHKFDENSVFSCLFSIIPNDAKDHFAYLSVFRNNDIGYVVAQDDQTRKVIDAKHVSLELAVCGP